jgi:hypothetical protein
MQSKRKNMRENAIPEEAKNQRTINNPTNSALDVETQKEEKVKRKNNPQVDKPKKT